MGRDKRLIFSPRSHGKSNFNRDFLKSARAAGMIVGQLKDEHGRVIGYTIRRNTEDDVSKQAKKEPQKIKPQLEKKLSPLVAEKIDWKYTHRIRVTTYGNVIEEYDSEAKAKEAEKANNEALEALMVQNKIELTEIYGHRVGVYQGVNVSGDADVARRILLELTNDIDTAELYLEEIFTRKTYSYVKVDDIKAKAKG